jgi:hypothetical protein
VLSALAAVAHSQFFAVPVTAFPLPREWLGNVPHTHRAIDDARGYANLLHFFLTRREPGGGYRPLLS